MRNHVVAIVVLVSAFCAVLGGAQTTAPGDHYLCYRAKPIKTNPPFPSFTSRTGDVVVDEFSTAQPEDQHELDLLKPISVCNPADKNDEGVTDADTRLEGYQAKITRTTPHQPRPYTGALTQISNQFGDLVLRLGKEDRLLVPSSEAIGTGGAPSLGANAVDHYKCYRAKVAVAPAGTSPFPTFTRQQVTVDDQFGARVIDVRKATRYCTPADKNGEDPTAPTHPGHLVCYQAKLARIASAQPEFVKTAVSTGNQFGGEVLSLTKLEDFCVPSLSVPPAVPTRSPTPTRTVTPTPTRSPTPTLTVTATPTPTSTAPTPTPDGTPIALRVSPVSRTVNIGGSGNFTATADFANGAMQNYTQLVQWASDDESIATISNTDPTRGRATGVAPGTATISATDPTTGITSTASSSDGTITVLGPLVSISLAPSTTTIEVGEAARFTATGHYSDGSTRNITQQVTYATSNGGVATTPNEVGDASRVDGVGPGTATITATDPGSGITTGAGEDAEITVLGALQRITLSPTAATRDPGDSQRFTATGHYAGGMTQNITQQVTYASSNPAVAAAPNDNGDKSRIDCVAAGTVTISATDPATGVTTSPNDDATLTVRGALLSITLSPVSSNKAVGQSETYAATGHYADGSTANITQQVNYGSSNTNVAVASNTPGNKSRVDTVGQGTATISATDPATGVTSDPSGNATLTVVP